jgi:hypothetical protein
LSGGGETFNLPFWQDTAGTSGDVPSETAATTVANLVGKKQVARRQLREKAWAENDISAVFSGSSAVESAAERVAGYWGQAYDQNAFNTLQGIFADNIANDSGDLVNDISGASGALSNFSDDGVIDAQALLGENGTLGRADQTDFAAIAMHPLVYAYARKLDLIDFTPVSGQDRPLAFYMGMQVIVDRNLPVDTGVYDTYLFKAGALQLGQTSNGYLPTELYREANQGFGIDQLWTRRVFTVHPVGFSWVEGSVAGVTPTDAELKLAANWDRAFNKENSGVVLFRHKINQS